MHEDAWFVTLTYNDDTLPEHGRLAPEDPRGFIKRLRKAHGLASYYLCGEYGAESKRPHYHAVFFGLDLPDRTPWRSTGGLRVFRSERLESTWGLGNVEFGAVTFGGASYIAGYVQKKQRLKDHPDAYTRVDPMSGELHDVPPEFARMSLKPAIGKRWIQKYWREVYHHDRVVMNGVEMKPPRFYDRWMEQDHSDSKAPCPGGCRAHQELLYEVKLARWDPDADHSPEKLAAREKIHRARNQLFSPRDAV